MSKTRSVIVAIFLLVIGAMFVVACGGDDDDAKTSATANQQSSSTAAASTTPAGGAATTAAAAATTAAVVGTQPATGGITSSNSCDLLTQSELEDALGEPFQEPVAVDVIDFGLAGGGTAAVGGCGFTSESYASSISLTYWYAPGQDDAIQAMIELACGQGQESIPDLGDRACWYDDRHAQIQLASNGNFLDIFATMSGDASDVLLTLAKKAVSKTS